MKDGYKFHPVKIDGIFSSIPFALQAPVQEMVAPYHVKNGKKNNDGSVGEIRISPKQLRDLLAFVILSMGATAYADEQDVDSDGDAGESDRYVDKASRLLE